MEEEERIRMGMDVLTAEVARRYRDEGCSLITVASDAVAVSRGTAAELAAARG